MNDTKLEEILNTSTVPAPSPSLRARVLAGFSQVRRRPTASTVALRKSLLAVASLCLAAFLVVVTRAIPQTLQVIAPTPPPPYTVDSEYVRYEADGTREVDMLTTSYNDKNAREVVLARSHPVNPLETSLWRTLDATRDLLSPLSRRLNRPDAAPFVNAGCPNRSCLAMARYALPVTTVNPSTGCGEGPVFGRQTILNYSTAALQFSFFSRGQDGKIAPRRMTVWMAPDLECFALRVSIEERQPDGAFRLVSGKQAVSVTWTP